MFFISHYVSGTIDPPSGVRHADTGIEREKRSYGVSREDVSRSYHDLYIKQTLSGMIAILLNPRVILLLLATRSSVQKTEFASVGNAARYCRKFR